MHPLTSIIDRHHRRQGRNQTVPNHAHPGSRRSPSRRAVRFCLCAVGHQGAGYIIRLTRHATASRRHPNVPTATHATLTHLAGPGSQRVHRAYNAPSHDGRRRPVRVDRPMLPGINHARPPPPTRHISPCERLMGANPARGLIDPRGRRARGRDRPLQL
ncbi:hypothetical protein HYPSUDRAFT_204289 [Hypholoma sublateritium FD-334 SS-4]|uniref:Uncharacterized protein n=1 Tax=Hypholoma sublateritium (strain FD-334 SS-4) TaxID=945553 RepID=A0A0D2PIL6_HYPSF|nr:hypothetical protein HYPSUDRAFT_204289 [Hypholoma sublateritium FD-334 SS-4]